MRHSWGGLAAGLWLALLPHPVQAWGTLGHEIVGRLATLQLSSQARAAVKALLGDRSLASVSNWADEQRDEHPESAPWHYVDIPRFSASYNAARDCAPAKGSCVIAAIERFRAELANPKAPRADRARALRFLVHLVADLHQPLHCIDDGDHGGNDVKVRFFRKPTNLHWVWDTGLLYRRRLDTDAYVRILSEQLAARDRDVLARGAPADWAVEAHAVAAADAYDIPAKSPPYLGRRYQDDNLPIAERQLLRAAARLARVIEEAVGRR